MQLKIKRSQRTGGVTGGKLFFALDVRLYLTAEEQSLVQRYKLGPIPIYDSETRKKHQEAALEHFDASQRSQGGFMGILSSIFRFIRGLISAFMMRMALQISINTLSTGQHVECKDLDELLVAEEKVRDACGIIRGYLNTAETFDGREVVFEF